MKKATLLLLFAISFVSANAQSKQQIIANETAFARLYGYVRYFYPGDEAASINWDSFAIYGAKKVAKCANREILKQALSSLFDPIVPTLQLVDSNETTTFNKQSVTPSSLSGYKTIAWQHVGGRGRSYNYKGDPFQSARTNRPIFYTPFEENKQIVGVANKQTIGAIAEELDVETFRNKRVVLKCRAKMVNGTGSGRLWGAMVPGGNKMSYFNSMDNNPIITTEWKDFEIRGKIDSNPQWIRVGALLNGSGELLIDDISISVKDGDTWKIIKENNFNDEKTGVVTASLLSRTPIGLKNPDYTFNIVEDPKNPAEKWLSIKSAPPAAQIVEKHTIFFKAYPKVGEYITRDIGSGLKIMMPISLYGNETHTYPVAGAGKFAELTNNLSAVNVDRSTADSLDTRFGDLVITWNVFQHFFPYFDVAKTNWTVDLSNAFAKALDDKDSYDFERTLQKLTAKLKDEHTRVGWLKDQNQYIPGISWEWIENKLVITNVFDKSVSLTKGDIITAIDNQSPEDYFKNLEQYISAATSGGLINRAEAQSLPGGKGTTLLLSFLNANNVAGQVALVRSFTNYDRYNALGKPDSVKQIDKNIMYINIAVANIKTINELLPQLQQCKAIICDLRNFMTDNYSTNHFIEYLLTKKDTATHWVQTAHIIYPDQEHVSGYDTEGWGLVPAKPHLNAKIIFLVDATDYSWAETYMGIIAHYKLATIIGQPTAGTNGDVDELNLPGEYMISFSGLKITQLDGSPHQGVGTKPDIYVTKTIKGVREGKDEFLEKAVEIATAASQ